ncbi:uncharacterized protein PGTG_08997 [Puccinia graminis f. sp. tritici CRL 75-36-700-3]|uniref:Uncharacterized protein n=1 Tax=Puccinia graminis f. sp. tritici (strain CRL 75-36-700-3 / race SCCL) TaxID=418459 RepID=E3KE51_PUCGT|nr:uncharacterized protein PGTG_08997 [Puccinia graminis f. sp. tritici CRL 75-36-700-3]EFP82801.1 hypothetical protein PGTG_08997 [Puccinia graminis f. sp. tritici CRL 75-36-700-3]
MPGQLPDVRRGLPTFGQTHYPTCPMVPENPGHQVFYKNCTKHLCMCSTYPPTSRQVIPASLSITKTSQDSLEVRTGSWTDGRSSLKKRAIVKTKLSLFETPIYGFAGGCMADDAIDCKTSMASFPLVCFRPTG